MNPDAPEPMVSVVIPVYNERETLDPLLVRCLASLRGMGLPFEVILVDDGSRDGSRALLEKAAREDPEVIAILLNRNYGQHAAIMAGFKNTRGEIVVTLDADLQNPPEEIPNLVAAMREGYDVVGTVRKHRADTAFRRIASWTVNRTIQKATGVLMSDYGCMLRAYHRGVVDAMLQCRETSTFVPVLANTFAGRTTEIAVTHAPRLAGESKYSLWRLITLNFDLVTSMTKFPLRILTVGGAFAALCGFTAALVLMTLRLTYGSEWAGGGVFTVFAGLFFLVGAIFVALGLVGEYVGRIYDDVRARPRYFIDKVVGAPGNAVPEVSERFAAAAGPTHLQGE